MKNLNEDYPTTEKEKKSYKKKDKKKGKKDKED